MVHFTTTMQKGCSFWESKAMVPRNGVTNTQNMQEAIGNKYIYLTYFVDLVGIKRNDWVEACTVWNASK